MPTAPRCRACVHGLHLELPDAPATHTLPDGLWAGKDSLRTLALYQCASLAQVPASLSSRSI